MTDLKLKKFFRLFSNSILQKVPEFTNKIQFSSFSRTYSSHLFQHV